MSEHGEASIPRDRGLPGAVGISRLRVYDWPSADGSSGGSPHLHTASSEAYVVIAGTGEVETLDATGHRRTPLAPGAVVWFTPGTVHRLINGDGRLEIITLMQNAGLPEAGDAVLTFPLQVLLDTARYHAAATLPQTDDPQELGAAARARRDLALVGYRELLDRVADDHERAMHELYETAATLVAPRVAEWRGILESGPVAQVAATEAQLAHLSASRPGDLLLSAVRSVAAEDGERWGMCGRLTVWPTRNSQNVPQAIDSSIGSERSATDDPTRT